MKNVDLYGCTTAESLIALKDAINDLYRAIGELGFYVSKEAYVNETTLYTAQELTQTINNEQFIGRPVLFINSNILAYVNTYNADNEQFTVLGAVSIKGDKGDTTTPDLTALTAQVEQLQTDLTAGLNSLEIKNSEQDSEIADAKSQILDVNEDLQNTKAIVSGHTAEIGTVETRLTALEDKPVGTAVYQHTLRGIFNTPSTVVLFSIDPNEITTANVLSTLFSAGRIFSCAAPAYSLNNNVILGLSFTAGTYSVIFVSGTTLTLEPINSSFNDEVVKI